MFDPHTKCSRSRHALVRLKSLLHLLLSACLPTLFSFSLATLSFPFPFTTHHSFCSSLGHVHVDSSATATFMLKRTKSRKDLRAEGMAVSAPRRSFGFDSSSSTPSPRSSPPLGFQSRLPVRNRNGSSTPQRKVSGATSTATRVALTPVHGRNTPSPHPRSDDKPHVKVVYSPRAEV